MRKRTISVSDEIAQAFEELMKEKNYMDITVSDVVRRAGVARASFYRNYNSVSDVLDYLLDDAIAKIEIMLRPILNSDDEREWRSFLFRYVYLCSEFSEQQKGTVLLNSSLVMERLVKRVKAYMASQNNGTLREKYGFPGRLVLVTSIIFKWIEDGMVESPEEIVDYMISFITKI